MVCLLELGDHGLIRLDSTTPGNIENSKSRRKEAFSRAHMDENGHDSVLLDTNMQ